MRASEAAMGLFDLFLSEEKKIQKHIRRLTNVDSQPEDRDASARWLADNGSDDARMGLLARFDMALDHHMKDTAEKDAHYALLASLGQPMVEPTRSWLRTCKSFQMPLRLLEALAGREAALESVLEMLEIERVRSEFRPEKKRELLVWLVDVRDRRVAPAASAHLDDFDEGVRYAAAEAIASQDGDEGREALAATLANPKEESNRLRIRLAEIFVAKRWVAPSQLEVPDGFSVRDGRLVRAQA